jgi:hypothetical protein
MSLDPRYRPWHITPTTQQAGVPTPVFPFVATTGNTIITTPGINTVTPASMLGMSPYMYLYVYPTATGVGTPEVVQLGDVTTLTTTTFKTNFQNTHSGYNLVSQKPGEIGDIEVGIPGQNTVLTLYMGPPTFGGTGLDQPGYAFSTLDVSAQMTFSHPFGNLYHTLFYTVTGTGFDITLWYLPHYF